MESIRIEPVPHEDEPRAAVARGDLLGRSVTYANRRDNDFIFPFLILGFCGLVTYSSASISDQEPQRLIENLGAVFMALGLGSSAIFLASNCIERNCR